LDPAVTVHGLATVLSGSDTLSGRIGGRLGLAEDDPVVGLNTAFVADGIVLGVAAGAKVATPIEIAHVYSGPALQAHLRHIVTVAAGASVEIIESFTGPSGVAALTNAVVELSVGEGAQVRWTTLQREGDGTAHLASLIVTLAARARLEHFVLNSGSAVTRNQLFLGFAGQHATLDTRGATLLDGRTHVDNTLVVDHAVPHGNSRELYKAVVGGEARSVFQGKIIVRKDAQKTDGKMSSNAVLLSETAEAMNKPELEIFADDVVCGHGATTGEIDERLRFYLMSRGIPAAEADTLLIVAFLGEAIEGIANEDLRAVVAGEVEGWLARRPRS
jgi:Fe-S cluster assembly protein SufD